MHKRVETELGYAYFQFFTSSGLYVQDLVLSSLPNMRLFTYAIAPYGMLILCD